MSKTILTIDEYRSLETRAGNMLGHDALMQRAGTAAADFIAERIPAGGRVTLLVGPGNNGGDALVAALELKKRGFAATVVLPGGRRPKSELAKRFFAEWCEAGGAVTDDPYLTEKADCVVDGLFGMGQTKPVAGDDLDAVLWFNERQGLKVSLDVPTGLNPYTGRWIGPRPGCRADATLTFLATKAGFYMEEGVDAAGVVHLFELDVSIPLSTLSVVEEDEFPHVLHRRAQNVHKGDFGRLVVTGGARGTFGAAILAARAALTMGAGLVTVDALAEDIPAFDPLEPALMFAVEKPDYSKFDVTVLGPGLGRSEAARARVKEALRTATILSVATSAIITIPVLIFRRELLAVVGDASLIDTGEEVMVALMLAAVFNAVSIVFVSWFQASGKGGPAMLMTIGIALLFFPAVYFGNMWFGFKGLTWAFPFTQVLACALGLVLFLATGGAKVPPAEAEVETEGSEDSDVQAAAASKA